MKLNNYTLTVWERCNGVAKSSCLNEFHREKNEFYIPNSKRSVCFIHRSNSVVSPVIVCVINMDICVSQILNVNRTFVFRVILIYMTIVSEEEQRRRFHFHVIYLACVDALS